MRRKAKNGYGKKGSVLDLGFIVIILFVTAIVMFVMHFVFNQLHDATIDDGTFENDNKSKDIMNTGKNLMDSWDYMFVFIMIGLLIMAGVTVFALKTHPIFYVGAFLIIAVMIIVAGILADSFTEFKTDDAFTNETATYVSASYVMGNFPTYILIIGGVIALMLYGKRLFT